MPRSAKPARGASGGGSIRKKTITRNGKTYSYWEGRYTVGYDPKTGKQRQKSITGKSKNEVAQKLRQVVVELDQGTYQEPCQLLMSEWLDIWLECYTSHLKPRALESYQCQVRNHIRPELGNVRLCDLHTHMVQGFYVGLQKSSLSPKTISIIHGTLHKALQQAVDIGYLRDNPAEHCVRPRVRRKPIKPLDDDAIRQFMAAAKGHRFERLYLLTLFTGLRQGEVLGLTWDCVDFAKGTLLIDKQLQRTPGHGYGTSTYDLAPTKSDRARKITAPPFVLSLLKQERSWQAEAHLQVGQAWRDTGLIFTNELGEALRPYTVYKGFKKLADQIGLPTARFHDLRHSYAVAAIKGGDDIKTVQENLGHATAVFTLDVYGHVTDQMKKESADRMEKVIESLSG